MFPGPLGLSLAGKGLEQGLWTLEAMQIRDFATDKHKTVDEPPYGGGTGMVMKPDVLDAAIEAAKLKLPGANLLYMSPRGVPITQKRVKEWSQEPMIILCGRFEGVDERVLTHHQMQEVSLGDFVLSGGEIPALALLDACIRLIPGIIGKADATHQESFGIDEEYAGLLEYPHYTRPPVWMGQPVPEVLTSGNHAEIRAWRRAQAERQTKERRPDLWEKYRK